MSEKTRTRAMVIHCFHSVLLTVYTSIKTNLFTCLMSLSLLTINYKMTARANKTERDIGYFEWYTYLACCIKKGCRFSIRKQLATCKLMYLGETLSCKCVEPPKLTNILKGAAAYDDQL